MKIILPVHSGDSIVQDYSRYILSAACLKETERIDVGFAVWMLYTPRSYEQYFYDSKSFVIHLLSLLATTTISVSANDLFLF